MNESCVRNGWRVLAVFSLLLTGCQNRVGSSHVEIKPDRSIAVAEDVTSIAVYQDKIYATSSDELYRLDGGAWTGLQEPPGGDEPSELRLVEYPDRLLLIRGELLSQELFELQGAVWTRLGLITDSSLRIPIFAGFDGRKVVLFAESDVHVFDPATGDIHSLKSALPDLLWTVRANERIYFINEAGDIWQYSQDSLTKLATTKQRTFGAAAAQRSLYLRVLDGFIEVASEGTVKAVRPNPPPGLLGFFAVGNDLYGQDHKGRLFRHTPSGWVDERAPWRPIGVPEFNIVPTIDHLTSANDSLFALVFGDVWQQSHGQWSKLPGVPAMVTDVAVQSDRTYVSTQQDVFSSKEGRLYVGDNLSSAARSCKSILSTPRGLYASCGNPPGLDFSTWGGVAWKPLQRPEDLESNDSVETLAYAAGTVYVGTRTNVFRMVGEKLQPIGFLGQRSRALTVIEGQLLAATDNGLFQYDSSTGKWSIVDPQLARKEITALSNTSTGSHYLYFGTAAGEIWQYDVGSRQATLYARRQDSTTSPAIRSLWFRRVAVIQAQAPDILLVGTDDGLYWTNDGGGSWTQELQGQGVRRILNSGTPKSFKLATTAGIFTLREDIPPQFAPLIIAFVRRMAKEWWWIAAVLVVFALVFPNRLSLKLLSLLPEVLQNVYFTVLSLSPFARRRFLSPYIRMLTKQPVVPTLGGKKRLPEVVGKYVELPFEPAHEMGLAGTTMARLKSNRFVWVWGSGGLGKTLLLWKLTHELLNDRSVPVVIDGHAVAGSLTDQMLLSVRGHAPVTAKTLRELMEGERFVILIDGFTEIRPAQRDQIGNAVAELLTSYPKLSVVVSSRLRPPFSEAGGMTPSEIRLLPLTEHSVRPFLKVHLRKKAEAELDYLTETIKHHSCPN